jgi:hypothetical protein
MQNILVFVLFACALVYVAKLLFKSFTSKKGCASGCGKCKLDFNEAEIPPIKQINPN